MKVLRRGLGVFDDDVIEPGKLALDVGMADIAYRAFVRDGGLGQHAHQVRLLRGRSKFAGDRRGGAAPNDLRPQPSPGWQGCAQHRCEPALQIPLRIVR